MKYMFRGCVVLFFCLISLCGDAFDSAERKAAAERKAREEVEQEALKWEDESFREKAISDIRRRENEFKKLLEESYFNRGKVCKQVEMIETKLLEEATDVLPGIAGVSFNQDYKDARFKSKEFCGMQPSMYGISCRKEPNGSPKLLKKCGRIYMVCYAAHGNAARYEQYVRVVYALEAKFSRLMLLIHGNGVWDGVVEALKNACEKIHIDKGRGGHGISSSFVSKTYDAVLGMNTFYSLKDISCAILNFRDAVIVVRHQSESLCVYVVDLRGAEKFTDDVCLIELERLGKEEAQRRAVGMEDAKAL